LLFTDSPVCRWARATRARGWEWDPAPTLQPGLRPGRQRLTMSVSNVAGSVFLRVLRGSVLKSVASTASLPLSFLSSPDPCAQQ